MLHTIPDVVFLYVFVFSLIFCICLHPMIPMSWLYTHGGRRSFECIMSYTLPIYRNCGVKQQQKESYHYSLSSSEILCHKKHLVMFCHLGMDDPRWSCGQKSMFRWGIPPTPISKYSKRTRRKWKRRSGSPTNVAAPRKYDLHLNCKERFRRNCVGMFIGTWQKQGFRK